MPGSDRALAAALRAPFVPALAQALDAAGGYLDLLWPDLQPSLETAGFLGSALYMADMALDAVEEVYEPVLTRADLHTAGLDEAALAEIAATLDVFHWVQPQLLLLGAALAEAWEQPRVGGQGRPEPRETRDRERAHLATPIRLADASTPPLPEVAAVIQSAQAPELYRAIAAWPAYLEAAWDELQHLSAYPLFRRRGRALYFYARSSTRFLAVPLEASREALRARGMAEADVQHVRAVLDAAVPVLATMLMHCCAMRVGLGIRTREVVQPA